MTAGFQVSSLGDAAFGATVSGLTRARLEDPAVRRSLNALWIDRGVLLFRDGEDSAAMQVALSECFGPLERHIYPETWAEGHPQLVKVKYYPDDGTCYEVRGERLGGWLGWHSDLVYTDTINRGGILRPIQLPRRGGRTGFIDEIPAYERLPERLKAKIEGLHVVYEMDLNMARHRFAAAPDLKFVRGAQSFMKIMRRQYQYPRTLHPMVYVQRETGRKVLNVSPCFAVGIYEMGGPDGDDLLAEVVAHCTDPANAYFHDWRHGEMILWDNWRTLHCATGVPADETRVMHRTTIAGDYALGRRLGGGVDLPKFDV